MLPANAQEEEHAGHGGEFGHVHFPISCSPRAQRDFDVAVAKLHSFFYPETTKAFRAIADVEPSCAMAFWGLAISEMPNPLVPPFAPAALARGRDWLEKARPAAEQTPRERDWIEALAVLYKDSDTLDEHTRDARYEGAMARLHEKYPDESEATIFYALALNMAVDLSDKTYAKQLKAAALLEKEWERQPDHPGIAHYIIHSYDYTPIAAKGLPAARRYAKVAPASPHALHMPSHIFTMAGMWQDSIASNLEAKASAEEYAAKFQQGGTNAGRLHAMDFLMYAYLQGAQDAKARAVLAERDAVKTFAGLRPLAGDTAYAAIPVRWVLERGDWKAAARLEPVQSQYAQAEAVGRFGRALGAARSGDAAAARREIAQLELLKGKLQESKQTFWVGQTDIQIGAASAWVALADGQRKKALELMTAAAEADDASEKHVAMENRLVPMRELLGEMLLEEKQPATALQAFEASLNIAANRLRTWAGAARAAELTGDASKASKYWQKLVDDCQKADTDRAELLLARKALAPK
jgi:hypothetical protein